MTKAEKKLIGALRWLLDDAADCGEDTDQETGKEFQSYRYARRIVQVCEAAAMRDKLAAGHVDFPTPEESKAITVRVFVEGGVCHSVLIKNPNAAHPIDIEAEILTPTASTMKSTTKQ